MALTPPKTGRMEMLNLTRKVLSLYFQDPPSDENEDGDWCLVSCHGDLHRLPKTMLFLGKEECDIEVKVRIYQFTSFM